MSQYWYRLIAFDCHQDLFKWNIAEKIAHCGKVCRLSGVTQEAIDCGVEIGHAINFRSTAATPSFSTTMFYIIGLGLCDEKDITVRGLEVLLIQGIS